MAKSWVSGFPCVLLFLLLPSLLWAENSLPYRKALNEHYEGITEKFSRVSVPSEGNKVAVLPVSVDNSSLTIGKKIEEALLESGKFEVIDRANLPSLIKEIEFQKGLEVDSKTVKDLSIKGVDYLVIATSNSSKVGAGKSLHLSLKMVNCSSASTVVVYDETVLISGQHLLSGMLRSIGPFPILVLGFLALLVLVFVFRSYRGIKGAAEGSVYSTVKDYLKTDKKLREDTAKQLSKFKSRVKEAADLCEEDQRSEDATRLNDLAEELDRLSQSVNGAAFGQDISRARAIPRDLAERLKASDLAFSDRVADFGRNCSRIREQVSEKRFDGLDVEVSKLKSEVSGLNDKFQERGQFLRSF